MAYSETLANRIREQLADLPGVEEKEMMGGIVFMYHEKMCVGVMKEELLCRIDHNLYEEAIEQPNCRPMEFTGQPMKGWILVDQAGIKSKEAFNYWIDRALDFNARAKKSKKKKSTNKS